MVIYIYIYIRFICLLVYILSLMNRNHTRQLCFNIHSILSFHLHLVLPNTFFPSGFPTKNLHTFPSTHALCTDNFIFPYLVTLIVLSEVYKSRSSQLCISLQEPFIYSLPSGTVNFAEKQLKICHALWKFGLLDLLRNFALLLLMIKKFYLPQKSDLHV